MIHSALALLVLSTSLGQQGPGLTYQVPSGWSQTVNRTNGIVTLTPRGLKFLPVATLNLLPPEYFIGTAEEFHLEIVKRGTSTGNVLDQPRRGEMGGFQVTRFRHLAPTGVQLWMSVYTARWADRGQAIIFSANTADIERRYAAAADSMVAHMVVPQTLVQEPSARLPAPSPGGGPTLSVPTGGASFGDYVYLAPEGWTTSNSGSGLLITSPPSQTGERCSFGLWPMTPASGDLFADANRAFEGIFREFVTKPYTKTPLARGVTADGWEYVFLKRQILPRGAQEPDLLGMVMVARLGDREATVSWFSKAQLYSSCVDFYTGLPEAWPRFFASLRFKNWMPPAGSGLGQKVTGNWESFGSSTGGGAVLQYSFTPASRYAFIGVGQRYMALSRWEAAVWTSSAFGDGSYILAGNELTLKADKDGKPDHFWVRFEQVSEDGGRTWSDMLYLMQPMERCTLSACPIRDSEIGFRRQNP